MISEFYISTLVQSLGGDAHERGVHDACFEWLWRSWLRKVRDGAYDLVSSRTVVAGGADVATFSSFFSDSFWFSMSSFFWFSMSCLTWSENTTSRPVLEQKSSELL